MNELAVVTENSTSIASFADSLPKLDPTEILIELQEHLVVLEEQGKNEQMIHTVPSRICSWGSAPLILSGIVTANPIFFVAAGSGLLFSFKSKLQVNKIIGKSNSPIDAVARLIGFGDDEDETDETKLTSYNYLSPRDKAVYALILFFGQELALYLSQSISEASSRNKLNKAIDTIQKDYGDIIRYNPADLCRALPKNQILANLFAEPDELYLLANNKIEFGAPSLNDSYIGLMSAQESDAPVYTKTEPNQMKMALPLTVDTTATTSYTSPFNEDVDVLEDAWGVGTARGSAPQPTPTPEPTPIALPPEFESALECILNSPFKSRAFFGAQRSGKSMLVSIISRKLHNRGVKVFHLNLLSYVKAGLDEDAEYTKHCVESIRADISRIATDDDGKTEVDDLVQDCVDMIQRWWDCEGEAILIVDEWAYLSAKDCYYANALQRIVGLISDKRAATGSSGMKREKAVYMIAPTMVAGNMTKSGLSIKSSDLVYVTVNPKFNVDWRGQGVTFDPQLFDQVQNNFSHLTYPTGMDAERIAYVGDRWYPLGTHPDMLKEEIKPHSGKYVNLAPAKYKPEPTAAQPVTQMAPVAVMERPVETEFDVSDLLTEFEVYEDFNRVMTILSAKSESNQAQLFVKLLELIQGLGQGQVFTVDSAFTKHKIFQWAKANVKNVDQSIPKVNALISQLANPKYAFVTSVEENTWKVNLH